MLKNTRRDSEAARAEMMKRHGIKQRRESAADARRKMIERKDTGRKA